MARGRRGGQDSGTMKGWPGVLMEPAKRIGWASAVVFLLVTREIHASGIEWHHKSFYDGFWGVEDGRQSEGMWVTLHRIRSELDLIFSHRFTVHLSPEIRLMTSDDLIPDEPGFQRQEILDLRRTFLDELNRRGEIFVDRAFAIWEPGDFSRVTLGKQRISWGTGFVFSALDVFNPLPPQEIVTPERRGVDGVRWQQQSGSVRWEGVYAFLDEDRRTGAVRARVTKDTFDTAVTAGRLAGKSFYGAETSGDIGSFGVRAEYFNREGEASYLVSIDHRIGERNLVEVEYFRNGWGTDDPRQYAFLRLPLLRGEIPALASKYVALSGRKQLNALEAIEVTVSWNAIDEGLYANPRYLKSLSDHSELVAGAQIFIASEPAEYSAFSNIYYVRVTIYGGK